MKGKLWGVFWIGLFVCAVYYNATRPPEPYRPVTDADIEEYRNNRECGRYRVSC